MRRFLPAFVLLLGSACSESPTSSVSGTTGAGGGGAGGATSATSSGPGGGSSTSSSGGGGTTSTSSSSSSGSGGGPDCTVSWSKRFGGASSDHAQRVAVDGSGDVIVAGGFQGTADLGEGPVPSAGKDDIFLARFSPAGELVWTRTFGGTGVDYVSGLTIDPAGDLILTGTFEETIAFGGLPLVSAGSRDIFLVKLSAAGDPLWGKRFGDADGQNGPLLAVGAGGDIFLGGTLHGTVDFGTGPLTDAGYTDAFVARLDSDGNGLWGKRFGDAANQFGTALAAGPSGEVFLAGTFTGTIGFGGATFPNAGGLASGYDMFLAAFDAAGDHVWSRSFDVLDIVCPDCAAQPMTIVGLAVGPSGGLTIAGPFTGTVDFGNGPLESEGGIFGSDTFIAQLSSLGDALWSKRFGASSTEVTTALALDAAGRIFLAGYFEGSFDLGETTLSSSFEGDVFTAIFDEQGAPLWGRSYAGDGYESAWTIAADPQGAVVVAGSFPESIDFGCGPLIGAGQGDAFLARIAP